MQLRSSRILFLGVILFFAGVSSALVFLPRDKATNSTIANQQLKKTKKQLANTKQYDLRRNQD